MATTRRLAAILLADVTGYSRLMEADEEGTYNALKELRRDLVDPRIDEHHGRVVKSTGDGFLSEFASIVDAVRCAVEIQRAMVEHNAGVPAQRRIEFRVGINLGDIIIEEGDIFGDGVNVAARLQVLAEPSGICVSGVVRDQVQNKLMLTFEDIGEQHVKNIALPVHVHRIPINGNVPAKEDHAFAFGSFRLIPAQRMLLDDGKPLRLGSRAFDILVALVEHAGETIPRDQLIARTWPDTIVEEGALRVHLAALRKALGDGRAGNRYIANYPGRGYAFVAPVTRQHARADTPSMDEAIADNNLPVPLTPIVGRQDVVAALAAQLARCRSLTIVGPGGIGKQRWRSPSRGPYAHHTGTASGSSGSPPWPIPSWCRAP
jgi:class 3 adenylate cyclase/DNA-binding winged helix-turn-helix (wHTH) protein